MDATHTLQHTDQDDVDTKQSERHTGEKKNPESSSVMAMPLEGMIVLQCGAARNCGTKRREMSERQEKKR